MGFSIARKEAWKNAETMLPGYPPNFRLYTEILLPIRGGNN